MKNTLLFLLALIVVPAWAGDEAFAPSTQKPTEMQIAPDTKACSEKLALLSEEASPKGSVESTLGCPTGCNMTNCPPPGGPVQCCNTTTHAPC